MITLKITGGFDKNHKPEPIQSLTLHSGKVYAIVGRTGSGKTQLIEDIESLTEGDGITGRQVELPEKNSSEVGIAHLSQNMNFIMDMRIREFIETRLKQFENANYSFDEVLHFANTLCGEMINEENLLTRLSGGQSRALMIADIAINSKAEIILIDEIENAGIDKVKAMELLIKQNKLIIVITHDPLLALYGEKRILMKNGAIHSVLDRTSSEEILIDKLYRQHIEMETIRKELRDGNSIQLNSFHEGVLICQ